MAFNVPKHKPVAQRKIFLGLTINSIKKKYDFPKSKFDQFFEVLKLVKSQALMPVCQGLLNLLSRALGQNVSLIIRNLYPCLHPDYFSQKCWSSLTSLCHLSSLGRIKFFGI